MAPVDFAMFVTRLGKTRQSCLHTAVGNTIQPVSLPNWRKIGHANISIIVWKVAKVASRQQVVVPIDFVPILQFLCGKLAAGGSTFLLEDELYGSASVTIFRHCQAAVPIFATSKVTNQAEFLGIRKVDA
jgi:hypothetical protein